ncbi:MULTISPECIES: hypothetical protein [Bradyrhizobium]|uniref:hypothetical protein n=1 Tax=Bradyrhizobium TaxID=374 RepID=UPI001B89F025|nr:MULTISPECIES: hypothetical protein [Bradyrhizobium]MBR0969382.1 hypothetical protein [Bradyrhizobium japonicum]
MKQIAPARSESLFPTASLARGIARTAPGWGWRSRAVMASHGGSIGLKPADQGAAFELRFPAA